jgi:hypothetical protein
MPAREVLGLSLIAAIKRWRKTPVIRESGSPGYFFGAE